MDAATITAWALIITAVGTLLTAVMGAYGVVISKRNSKHIKKVEAATNGMKDQLVEEVRKASFKAGEKSEKDKGN